QHGLDALRRGRARRPALGRGDRRPARARRALGGEPRGDRGLGREAGLDRLPRRGARDALVHVDLPLAHGAVVHAARRPGARRGGEATRRGAREGGRRLRRRQLPRRATRAAHLGRRHRRALGRRGAAAVARVGARRGADRLMPTPAAANRALGAEARIFPGWWMVAAAVLAQAFPIGGTTYSFVLVLKPVAEAFGRLRRTVA